MPLRGQLILLHTHMDSREFLMQAESPSIYMYMAYVLAYNHRLPMLLEYFVNLLVGFIHVVCNCMEFWTMRNLHTLLGAQRGFRHELATKYACIINLKTKKVVIIDAHTVWS